MRLHERTLPVQGARAKISLALIDLQVEHDLTDVEMAMALHDTLGRLLTHMLRAERHPEHPDHKADEAFDDDDSGS